MYFSIAKEFTSHTLEHIGNYINKDHATVLHGIKMCEILKQQKGNNLHKDYDDLRKDVSEVLYLNSETEKEQRIRKILDKYVDYRNVNSVMEKILEVI